MMSEPRPSSPQSRTEPGDPPLPMGSSRAGSAGSSRTSSQAIQTFFARGLRKVQPDKSLPLNNGFQPSSDRKLRGAGSSRAGSAEVDDPAKAAHPRTKATTVWRRTEI